jgi:hypothetical protein
MSDARNACYHAIRVAVKDGIGAYYREFPERFFDDRSQLAIKHSMAGLEAVFVVLDQYEIQWLSEVQAERNGKTKT